MWCPSGPLVCAQGAVCDRRGPGLQRPHGRESVSGSPPVSAHQPPPLRPRTACCKNSKTQMHPLSVPLRGLVYCCVLLWGFFSDSRLSIFTGNFNALSHTPSAMCSHEYFMTPFDQNRLFYTSDGANVGTGGTRTCRCACRGRWVLLFRLFLLCHKK